MYESALFFFFYPLLWGLILIYSFEYITLICKDMKGEWLPFINFHKLCQKLRWRALGVIRNSLLRDFCVVALTKSYLEILQRISLYNSNYLLEITTILYQTCLSISGWYSLRLIHKYYFISNRFYRNVRLRYTDIYQMVLSNSKHFLRIINQYSYQCNKSIIILML